ncbi:MAG: DNA alkylation repair protein [Anaerolineaceae bacterium]|nr:DNA alkylation repair protein [Anaerolineaceae bacterium]
MPAIHIDRLIQQIQTIFEPESPGPIFRENFRSLLEVHANLAYRPGVEIQRKSFVPKLHLAPIVMHHLQQQFSSLAKTKPELALEYADQLWIEDLYEARFFSAVILGSLPIHYNHEVIERFVAWGSKISEKEIHQVLFKYGTQNIKQSSATKWLDTIQSWVDSNAVPQAITAIYALQTLINDPSFLNLPKVFRILTPLFSMNNRRITTGLTLLIDDLALISPIETSHYLSNLLLSTSYSTPKLIVRKSMKSFPENEQKKLRTALSNLPDIET